MAKSGNTSQDSEKTVKLDLKDRRIIQELNRNARQSVSSIAKRLGTSKQAVNYKLNRMLREGVIRGFVVFVDTQRIGYTYYNLYLQLGWISQENEKELEEFFKKEPNITWAASGIGRWNLAVSILAKDAAEFHKTSIKIFAKCKNLISHATFITTEAYTLPHQYLFQDIPHPIQKTEAYVSQKRKPVKLEEEDMNILWELSKNARITNTELSQKLNMKTSTVKYKIKKMEKTGVIQSYKPLLNVSKLKKNRHIIMLKLNYKNQEQEQKLFKYLKSMPYIRYIAKGIGRWGLTITIHQENMEQFNQTINQLKENFKDTIIMLESTAILKVYKCNFFTQNIKS